MFEQQRLIPNLNEIMVKFANTVEETNVESVKTVTEEEIKEKNVKTEVEVEAKEKK